MSGTDYASAALSEHRFWLQILGDHARFIFHALSPGEKEEIQRAHYFMGAFEKLLAQARQPAPGIPSLTKAANQCAQEFREFKLNLLRRRLVGKIKIELPPTFFNHMVNELEEYLRILECLLSSKAPPVDHPVHHHLLWLLDAAGHSGTIADNLDMVEKREKETAQAFMQHFLDAHNKALEMAGYMRAKLKDFPALSRFTGRLN